MPPPRQGPALLKKRLGEQLRQLRVTAGVTVSQTAVELGCGEGKVRHMENGRNVPSKPDLTVMVGLYGVPRTVHDDLENLRKAATTRGWWSAYRLPSWLHSYVGLEADATLIRNFEVELVPGLLQIEPYIRDVHELASVPLSSEDLERRVAARLKRQELLAGDTPVTHHAIISEAALHRVRRTEYAEAQYLHLLTMARKPNITIAVLPFAQKLHRGMAGGFHLLDFPRDVSTPIAYFDTATGGQLEHDPKVVALLSEVYDHLAALAMNTDQTIAFIERWMKGT